MGEEIDPDKLRKAEAMFSDWKEKDANKSPVEEFLDRARKSPSLSLAMTILQTLPQVHCNCPRHFFEGVELVSYFLGQLAGIHEKQRTGELQPLVERSQVLMKQLADEGMDASDLLILSGLLASALLFAIAKNYVDAGRLEP